MRFKCKKCKEFRNIDWELEQPTDKVCIYCKYPDKYRNPKQNEGGKN